MTARGKRSPLAALGTAAVAILALAATGCASMQTSERGYRLKRATSGYAYAIRWGNMREASAFLRPRNPSGDLEPVDLSVYDGLSVISVQTSVGAMNTTNDEARVEMAIGYHFHDSVTIRTVGHSTLWWWHYEDERWYHDGDLPVLDGR